MGSHFEMCLFGFTFLIAMLALSAVWIFAINTSIKALRLADPALYRAAVDELAGRSFSDPAKPDAPVYRMRRWMRRMWHHRDIHKHRAVRRWMYVHQSAHTALIILFSYGVAMLFLF